MASAQDLISTAYRHFAEEIPALERLKLVARVELRGRGDVQVYGLTSPGPVVSKGEPEGARLDIAMPRSELNERAESDLEGWADSYGHGNVKVGGDPDVVKLLATVIAKHRSRAQFRRVR